MKKEKYQMRKLFSVCISIVLIVFAQSKCNADTTGRNYAKIFGFELEKVTFKEVMSKLGTAKIYKSGDAGDSDKRINYYIKKDNVFITFHSSEMGGGIYINGITMSFLKPKEEYTINNSIRLNSQDLSGIKLGMTKNVFFKSFPSIAIIDKSKPEYNNWDFDEQKPDTFVNFTNIIPMTREEIKKSNIKDPKYQIWTESITIIPVFSNDKLTEIEIDKVTSD